MLLSIGIIILLGLIFGELFALIKLPKIVGMIVAGILISPNGFALIDPQTLQLSAPLRQIALVIILTRAGLSLDINKLKKVGRSAILMSFVPASFEILGYILLAPLFLGIDILDAAIMGCVMAAVSPAVIVPKMIKLIEKGYGRKNSIPELILAGASVDDVFVIVIFTSLVGLKTSGTISYLSFLQIPISIVSGIFFGAVFGKIIVEVFKKLKIKFDKQTIILIALSFFLLALEDRLKGIIPYSALLSIMTIGVMINRNDSFITDKLSVYYGKLWTLFEIILFVFVGITVDMSYVFSAGFLAIALLLLVLIFRMTGVYVSLAGSKLSSKEKLFCGFAYIPKATVQAAIGAIPLSLGLSSGNIILTVSVLAILVTAPLGVILIEASHKKLLDKS